MPLYEIKSFEGGISPFGDRGIRGAFKFASGIDIRKSVDTLSCQQGMVEEGLLGISHSSSPSLSPSPSISPSASASRSTSPSGTPSISNSASRSPSSSASPSASTSSSVSRSASPSSSISGSPSPSAGLNNVFEDLVIKFVKCSDGNTYGFGNTGYVYRRLSGSSGFWRNVYRCPYGAIKGAEEKPSSTGKTYLQFTTDTKVLQKEIPADSNWGDVTIVAENLTGADWHWMKQVGGANMIGNGSKLAFVGFDDSFTNEGLQIPGSIAKTLVERSGRVVIGTYKPGYPNKGANGAIDTEVPLVQRGDDGEVFFANFTDSVPAWRFPGGGRVNPGGVANEGDQTEFYDWEQTAVSWIDKQVVGNMSLWGVFDGDSGTNGIYTYGRKKKDHPITLNLEYVMDVDEIGAVENVDGVTIASYRDGTDFGVRAVDSNNKAEGIWEGLEFRSPIKQAEGVTVWPYVEVFMKALPSNCSVKFYYKKNKQGSWVQALTVDGASEYSTVGGKKATFRIGEEMDIYEPRLVLTPYGNETPEIYRIRTYFK